MISVFGIEIVRNAITAPIKQLISNAGFDSSIIEKIYKTIRRRLYMKNIQFMLGIDP